MIRTALLAALSLAGCATTPPPPADEGPRPCDVTVSFGSFGMSVDHELKTRIMAVVASDHGVQDSEERPWGREGESDLCIYAPGPGAADQLFDQIAAQIPETSRRAPTTVTHRDGRRDQSTWPDAP